MLSQWLWFLCACALLACSQNGSGTPHAEGEEAGGRAPHDAAVGADLEADVSSDLSVESGQDAGLEQPSSAASAGDGGAAEAGSPVAGDSGAASAGGRVALVLPALWQALGPGDDPFQDRPQVILCPASSAVAETLGGEGAFGVDTGACTYLAVMQPTRHEVLANQTISVRLWHFELSAPEPAEAHAAVRVDGLLVLDERVAIPQPGGLISRQLRVERSIPAGAPVHFHLHNHGANSWALVEVSVGP